MAEREIEKAFRERGGKKRGEKEYQCMAEREAEKTFREGGGKRRGEKE